MVLQIGKITVPVEDYDASLVGGRVVFGGCGGGVRVVQAALWNASVKLLWVRKPAGEI